MPSLLDLWVAQWALWAEGRRQRQIALRHAATVARAIFEGSTASYTLTPDLPREPASTEVSWP